jgi:ABC-type transport system involved in multi-copper enzyme maturation permease subunit
MQVGITGMDQEKCEMKDDWNLALSGIIAIISFVLMILVQSIPPNQDYMNPLGACFFVIFLFSVIFFGMGILFKL